MSCRRRIDGLRLRPQFGSKYDGVLNRLFFPGFSSNLEAHLAEFRKTVITNRSRDMVVFSHKAPLVIRKVVGGFRDPESRDFDETHGARNLEFHSFTS